MRHPRQSHQRLIEVHVAIDKARYWRGALADGGDTPASDPDIDEPPIGEAAMGQECVEVHDLFLAEVSVGKPNSKPNSWTLRHAGMSQLKVQQWVDT